MRLSRKMDGRSVGHAPLRRLDGHQLLKLERRTLAAAAARRRPAGDLPDRVSKAAGSLASPAVTDTARRPCSCRRGPHYTTDTASLTARATAGGRVGRVRSSVRAGRGRG